MCNHKKWTPDCLSCDDRFKTVKRWNHRREVVFPKRQSKNKFYFGLELEVECGRYGEQEDILEAVLEDIKDTVTNVWEFKHDGSLRNGLEFESQPMSFSQWENYGELLEWISKLPKCCRSHDTTSCGLHIHVNRDGFSSDEDICKINYFVNKHQDKFEKLGRREWNRYCSRSGSRSWIARTYEKYEALNLSRSDTIEFRFPKGTLYTPTIRATVALINAICEIIPTFTREQLQRDRGEWAWGKFLEAIATGNRGVTSKHTYKLKLHAYLNKKGLWSKELTRKFKES